MDKMTNRSFVGLLGMGITWVFGSYSIIVVEMLIIASKTNFYDLEKPVASLAAFPVMLIGVAAVFGAGYMLYHGVKRIHPRLSGMVIGFNFGFFCANAYHICVNAQYEYVLSFGMWFFLLSVLLLLFVTEQILPKRKRFITK